MKIQMGDTFEIKTAQGLGYIQFAYRDKNGIEYVRVIRGLFDSRPAGLVDLVGKKEQFIVGFPLTIAANKELVNYVARFLLPADFEMPRYMRAKHYVRGKFLGWHIVDISNWKRKLVSNLSEQEVKMSPLGVWNDTLLKERIATGWCLENWV